jgi:hypothetical protein
MPSLSVAQWRDLRFLLQSSHRLSRAGPHGKPGQVSLAGRPSGPRDRMGFLLRLSQAETNEALALPALKRMIRVETLSQSAKALLPPA